MPIHNKKKKPHPLQPLSGQTPDHLNTQPESLAIQVEGYSGKFPR